MVMGTKGDTDLDSDGDGGGDDSRDVTPLTIYLAGSIRHAPDDGRTWRNDVIETYADLDFNNPLDEHDPRDSDGDLPPANVVLDDIRLIENADVLLVKWDYGIPQHGTMSEIIYARYVAPRPVVLWCPDFHSGVTIDDLGHWVRYHTDVFVATVEDAIEWINDCVRLDGETRLLP